MGIGHHQGRFRSQKFFHSNVVDLQIKITQRQGLFEHLPDVDLGALRLSLPRERKQILHHPMCALCLLEQFGNIILRPVV